MYNYLLDIEYEGTRYKGFSNPKSSNTIADHLLCAILRCTGLDDIIMVPAVKTEPGVHAVHQNVNFRTEKYLNIVELKTALNNSLPQDIAVLDVRQVPERFDASLNLKQYSYLYKIDTGTVPSVFKRHHSYYSGENLDTASMDKCAKCLIGKHDFRNFCSIKKKKNTVHTITEISLTQDTDNHELLLTMTADRFHKGMPLMIVDLLLKAGKGEIDENEWKKALDDETYPFSSAFSGGLYLLDTTYL